MTLEVPRVVRAFHALQDYPVDDDRDHRLPDATPEDLWREPSAHRRRRLLRSLCKSCGNALKVGLGVQVVHADTFELGDGVFIGGGAFLQGRHDGRFVVGRGTWIGPLVYLDCRDLVLGEYVGLGPGVKILGSEHTGDPLDIPITQTDLLVRPVRVDKWADIGTGAVIMPGVTIGEGAIVGAGAVVTNNVEAYSVVAGVPARLVRRR